MHISDNVIIISKCFNTFYACMLGPKASMLLTGLISHWVFFFSSSLYFYIHFLQNLITLSLLISTVLLADTLHLPLVLYYQCIMLWKAIKKLMHCIILMFYIQYVDHFVISLLIEVGTKTDSMLKMIRYENMWKYVFFM